MPQLTVYLDSTRAGHAYFELARSADATPAAYGFYPEGFDGEREIFFDHGELREDSERLAASRSDDTVNLIAKTYELTAAEYGRAKDFVERQERQDHAFVLVGSNCVDFIQDLYVAAKGEAAGHFLRCYDDDELQQLSAVGFYGRVLKLLGFGEARG